MATRHGNPITNAACFVLCRKACIPAQPPSAPPITAVIQSLRSLIRHACVLALCLSIPIQLKSRILITSRYRLINSHIRIPHYRKSRYRWIAAFSTYFNASFALEASCANAFSSEIASSESILRFTSIPASLRPCIKRL